MKSREVWPLEGSKEVEKVEVEKEKKDVIERYKEISHSAFYERIGRCKEKYSTGKDMLMG